MPPTSDSFYQARRFVIPVKTSMKAMKAIMTRFKDAKGKENLVFEGHAYMVWKIEFRVRKLLINSLEEYARNMDEADPVKAFKNRAGKAAKYFDIKADGRRVALERRKNACTFSDNRAGMFIMLCSEDVSWELMMAAYDARRLTEQAFDTEKASDRRLRSGNFVTVRGRYFIQFVAQILRAEIRATLREKDAGARYTEEGIMATLSTLNVLEYGGQRGLSEITKNVRRILKLFDVDVPKQPMFHAEIFDMASYIAKSTLGQSD